MEKPEIKSSKKKRNTVDYRYWEKERTLRKDKMSI